MRNIESEKFQCCKVRTWALFIGWAQTILSAIVSVSYFLFLTLVAIAVNQASEAEKEAFTLPSMNVTSIVINVVLLLVNCIAGVVLIVGVKTEESVKLRIWKTIQILLLSITVIVDVVSAFMSTNLWLVVFSAMGNILYILLTICCIGLVDIHRYELEDSEARARANSRS